MLYFLFNFFFLRRFYLLFKKNSLEVHVCNAFGSELTNNFTFINIKLWFWFLVDFLEVLRRMMILVPSVCWKCWKGRACWNVKMAAKIVYIIIAYQSVCTTVDVGWNMRFISPLDLLVSFFFIFVQKRTHVQYNYILIEVWF